MNFFKYLCSLCILTSCICWLPGEDVNELLSDLDDNLEGGDNEPLDVAELSDTPSISSVELDSDLY